MDLTGKLHFIGETVQVSEKFKKRDFVIKDDSSQYVQYIQFQLTQDKTNLIELYSIGDEIKVHFNLNGKEWKNPQGELKHFNTLVAWRLESVSINSTNQNTPKSVVEEDDGLPF